jgi:hypothetical protein
VRGGDVDEAAFVRAGGEGLGEGKAGEEERENGASGEFHGWGWDPG